MPRRRSSAQGDSSQSSRQTNQPKRPRIDATPHSQECPTTGLEEHVLRESQARLAGIIDSAMDAIITVDATQRITLFNAAAEQLFGYTFAQMHGQLLDNLIPERYRAAHRHHIVAFGRTGVTTRVMGGRLQPLVGLRADGNEFPIEATISQAEVGGQKLYTAIIRDVTERQQAEERRQFLAEATAILASSLDYNVKVTSLARLVIPTLADYSLLYLADESGQYRQVACAHVVPAKEHLLHEIGVRYQFDLSNPRSLVAQVLRTQSAVFATEVAETEAHAITRDARLLAIYRALDPSSYLIVPIRAHEQVQGALFLAMAESRRRYQASDLVLVQEFARQAAIALDNARLYREAQDAIQLRDTFLSIAAHELKTPLTALLGNAQLVLRRALQEHAYNERDRRAIQVIAEQAHRLNQLIRALLDVSRIQAGRLEIQRTPVDLGALAQRVVEEFQPTLSQHIVVCTTPSEALVVEGDELRLEQVMQNLLSNAVKYSPNGGQVTVDVAEREGFAVVTVSDQGIGVPTAELPKLFQRFYRASNADHQYISGMGIGLYVVKEIVTLHGGTVTIESTEGVGSIAAVTLPLAKPG